MHPEAAVAIFKSVLQRIREGDCPTDAPHSIETLEDAMAEMGRIFAKGHTAALKRAEAAEADRDEARALLAEAAMGNADIELAYEERAQFRERAEAAEGALATVRADLEQAEQKHCTQAGIAKCYEADLALADDLIAAQSVRISTLSKERHVAQTALASRDEALREAQEAFEHIVSCSQLGSHIEATAEDWLAKHAPTAAPTGETQHGE